MPEILTESFCERCGTRYTFEATAPKARPLTKLKLVSRGLKNYVLSDETSLDEAFAEARSDEQRAISSQQLDAFHKAFNFCMTCRQYTCGNCWNEVEGRCLTCAPHLGHEILPGPFPVVDAHPAGVGAGGNGSSPITPEGARMIEASAWPTVDLRQPPESAPPTAGPASPGDNLPAAAILATTAATVASSPDAATVEPAPQSVDDRAAAAAVTTTSLLGRFRPGRRHEPEAVAAPDAVAEPEVAAEPGTGEVEIVAGGEERAEAAPAAEHVAATEAVAAAAVTAEPVAGQPVVADVVVAAAVTAAVVGESEPETETGLTPAELAEVSAAAIAAKALRGRTDTQPEVARESATEATTEQAHEIEPPEEQAAPIAAESVERTVETTPPLAEPAPSPVWSMVAPETAAPATPGAGPAGAPEPAVLANRTDRADQPRWPQAPAQADGTQWPATPQWPPSPTPRQGDLQWPVAAMSDPRSASAAPAFAAPAAGSDVLWAESSRDVLSRPGSGVQACVTCGLPLSATARFCRRCGSRQG